MPRLHSGYINAVACLARRGRPGPLPAIPAILKEEMNMEANLHPSVAVPTIVVHGRKAAIGQALLAALLGATLIWGVGFSHISAFHNAAHDTRHSNAFPCH
jgi:cobalt transporter subunit CbtB